MGLLPDTQKLRAVYAPWRTYCDACRDRYLVVYFEVGGGESVPAFQAHAQFFISGKMPMGNRRQMRQLISKRQDCFLQKEGRVSVMHPMA